jgi:hypothetical protein
MAALSLLAAIAVYLAEQAAARSKQAA